MKDAERLFVLTGGPGSGKSTLVEALHKAGYASSIEAGRGIIQDQMAIGGCALPWLDPGLFAERMLSWEMRSYPMGKAASGPVFFDRGVVDLVGYFRLVGLPVPKHVEDAAESYRYNRRVFIAPPWEEIYEQDRERKPGFEEAVRTHEAMRAAYRKRGYELVELPRASVERRLHFVLHAIEMKR